MKKLLGLFLFLLVIYALLLLADPGARSVYNHFNLGKRIGLYGILSLGAWLCCWSTIICTPWPRLAPCLRSVRLSDW
jgi:hypothetical protein